MIKVITKQKTALLKPSRIVSTIQFGMKVPLPAYLLSPGDHILVGYPGIHPREVWKNGGIHQICPIKSINKIRN